MEVIYPKDGAGKAGEAGFGRGGFRVYRARCLGFGAGGEGVLMSLPRAGLRV